MDDESKDIDSLLHSYAKSRRATFIGCLGEGKDGRVFATTKGRAVKFLRNPEYYNRELRAYFILREEQVEEIDHFQIPLLIDFDDGLLAIELTIVSPPFIVDFVSAHTDEEIAHYGFTDDVLVEREAFWVERFDERWPTVAHLRDRFHELTGLTLLDLSHNNIRFE